jgi:uncharacterized protein (TIGR00299 family) protein
VSGRVLHLNCAAGVSGDMLAGALLDLGADLEAIRGAVASLGLGEVAVAAREVRTGGLAATAFVVTLGPTTRRLPKPADVESVLAGASLSPESREKCRRVFGRLAAAEARAHGTTSDDIHFHELGSADTVVDVVATAVGLESLGVERVLVSPVNVGAGTVRTDHGVFPVPAPATAVLLEGFRIFSDGEEGEKTTPTGAALVTTLGTPVDGVPPMTVARTGYGAGTADFRRTVNVLQALIGEEIGEGGGDRSVILECTIDDMNPQVYPWLIGRLLGEGAQDAYLTPVVMKKGRPGHQITVIAPPPLAERLAGVLLAESTTIGLRRHQVERVCSPRRLETMDSPWGPVAVKVITVGGRARAVPEYEDCRRAAEASGLPLIDIMASLGRLARERYGTNG